MIPSRFPQARPGAVSCPHPALHIRAPRTGGVEYDVRNVLRFYSGNGPAAVSGLMRFSNMSREDARVGDRLWGIHVDRL